MKVSSLQGIVRPPIGVSMSLSMYQFIHQICLTALLIVLSNFNRFIEVSMSLSMYYIYYIYSRTRDTISARSSSTTIYSTAFLSF